jgi:D-alanyl-D-alanine carboxypeptidase
MAANARRNGSLFARALAVALLLAGAALIVSQPARAQVGTARYSSIVVDAHSGNVLEADSPDALRQPASLAKLMTLYLTFEALRDRRITLDTLVPVSAHAASMEPTKLGLQPGEALTVEEAILGLVTRSANDAASALGELLGGSEDRFAQIMTLRARALGMDQTVFANASGLPAPDEWTTARDMAVLARRLQIDFPEDYHFFSAPRFVFHRQVIFNHDTMLKIYPGADGMKTGFTDASGHNMVTSAARDGVRLIGVVLGASSNVQRDVHMTALLNQGFTAMNIPIVPIVPVGRPTTTLASRLSFIGTAHAETVPRFHPTPAAHAVPADEEWAVQVGAFGSQKAARHAAVAAERITERGDLRVEGATRSRHTAWRAQLTRLSEAEARSTCLELKRHHTRCTVMRDEPRLASR